MADTLVFGFASKVESLGYEVLAAYPGYIYFSRELDVADKNTIDEVANEFGLLGVEFHKDNGIDYITYRPRVVSTRGVY